MGLELCACSAGVSHRPTGSSHPVEFLGATKPERGAGWGCAVLVILLGGIPVKNHGMSELSCKGHHAQLAVG